MRRGSPATVMVVLGEPWTALIPLPHRVKPVALGSFAATAPHLVLVVRRQDGSGVLDARQEDGSVRRRLLGELERRRDRLVVENVGQALDRRVERGAGERIVREDRSRNPFAPFRVDRYRLQNRRKMSTHTRQRTSQLLRIPF